MPTRRALVRTLAAAAVGSAAVGSASAGHDGNDDWSSAQPSHVSIDFPETEMDRYRPAVQLPSDSEERSRWLGLWGWRATSDQYDRDWYVYWGTWTNQVGNFDFTSHQSDHEPLYVGVQNGEPVEVLYSAYHWLRGAASTPGLPLESDTHVQARPVIPWHQWQIRELDTSTTTLPEVYDLRESFEDWLDNGMRDDLRIGSVHDPPTMRTAPSWWQDDLAGARNEAVFPILRSVGIGRPGGFL